MLESNNIRKKQGGVTLRNKGDVFINLSFSYINFL
jgi:hypothetical protein